MKTSLSIRNNNNAPILFLHEPEAWEFFLPANEEIIIEVDSIENSIQLTHSLEEGKIVINISDDASFYNVFYKGIDVFKEY